MKSNKLDTDFLEILNCTSEVLLAARDGSNTASSLSRMHVHLKKRKSLLVLSSVQISPIYLIFSDESRVGCMLGTLPKRRQLEIE
jgi:hypothetical protein